jgi:tRNA(Ile)-lysidine synthase
VRPLLHFTREQTAAYCTARGLAWREDETNESDAFARGRVRRGLTEALLAVHPGAHDNVLALAEVLRDEAAVLDWLVEDVLSGARAIELARLRELPVAVQRLVVQRLADEAAGGLAPGAARRAEEIGRLSDAGTAMLDIGNGVRAVAEYGQLRFEPLEEPETVPAPVRLAIPGSAVFGDYEVRCELAPPTRESGVLDRAALGRELRVRCWRPGDRMSPIGLGGTKSLQDLFTARRIPRARRATVPVVETADGEIAWVPGVATSERFKVTDATVVSARLSARETKPRARGRRQPDDAAAAG